MKTKKMDFSENFVPPKKEDKVDWSVWWTDRDGSLVIESGCSVDLFGGSTAAVVVGYFYHPQSSTAQQMEAKYL